MLIERERSRQKAAQCERMERCIERFTRCLVGGDVWRMRREAVKAWPSSVDDARGRADKWSVRPRYLLLPPPRLRPTFVYGDLTEMHLGSGSVPES